MVEQYVLTNPAFNYAQFLLRAVLPMVLHVVIAISTCYAIGTEFSRRGVGTWLRSAGGSPLTALAGKLAPLFAIFMLMMVVLLLVIHGAYQIPFRGDEGMMVAAACLLIAAYQGLAALLVLLVRNLALGLSLTAIMVSPAFGYAGVGFPIAGMQAFARGWGSILPLRWYMQILFDQAARGAPVADSARPFVILAALALLFGGLAWWRLAALARRKAGVPAAEESAPPPLGADPGFGGIVIAEIRRVLGDRSVMGLMVIAPVLYGAFYPQPYLGQILRHLPIAVVDLDQTELSRRLVMALDADAGVQVAVRANTIAQAQQELFQRHVFGILEIPPGTSREFLKGNVARLPAFVDSAYFLVFSRTLQGIVELAGNVTAELVSHGARSGGEADRLLAVVSPASVLGVPLFNPTGGYASYVVPAAFVLILQQTLLIGAAMLGGVAFESGGSTAQLGRGSAIAVLGHGSRPSDHLCSGPAALSRDIAADLRLLDAGEIARSVPLRGDLHPRHQLLRPGRGHMVQAARDRRGSLRRDHLAAVLPGRPVLAGGGDPARHAPDRAGLPLRSGDRRHGADQSDGGQSRRGLQGLDQPARPGPGLLPAGGAGQLVCGAGGWLMPARWVRRLGIGAVLAGPCRRRRGAGAAARRFRRASSAW